MTEPQATTFEAVVERLEKAERQLCWGQVAGLVVLLLLGAGLMMGQARSNGRTVEAEKFVLLDGEGNERALLSAGQHGVALALSDRDGTTRVRLYVNEQGTAGVSVRDAEGMSSAGLLVFKDGSPKMSFVYDGGLRASLRLGRDGLPALSLLDDDGMYRAGLQLEGDGRPTLYLGGGKKVRVVLSLSKEGVACLSLGGKDGEYGAVLRVEPDGSPGLTLYDTDKEVIFQAP